MKRRLFALFLLIFVTLAVVGAPTNVEKSIVETRANKALSNPKPVVKSKPLVKPKPIAKPAAEPVLRTTPTKAKPVGTPKPVPLARPKPKGKQAANLPPQKVAKPVLKKPVTKPTSAPKQPAPPISCSVPVRKLAVRRFLKLIGLARGPSTLDCKTASTSVSTTGASLSRAGQRKANKAAAKAAAEKAAVDANTPPVDAESKKLVVDDKAVPIVKVRIDKDPISHSLLIPLQPEAAKKPVKPVENPQPKPAQPVAAPAPVPSSASAKRPVGMVENAPTKGVICLDNTGGQEKISLADIETAVKLAQAGPLQKPVKPGQKNKFFPKVFSNFNNEVDLPEVCNGRRYEEHAVGRNMANFHNNGNDLQKFNQFRVVITQPDATGKITFCGVMTHGTQKKGKFEKDLCTELA
ncbi:hypothetical protein B0H19DRAFT_1079634 [Mycena capillaripes]|nr:hypothetical protein B0H19DRAFT_1079634 [Mycena capillaripes]